MIDISKWFVGRTQKPNIDEFITSYCRISQIKVYQDIFEKLINTELSTTDFADKCVTFINNILLRKKSRTKISYWKVNSLINYIGQQINSGITKAYYLIYYPKIINKQMELYQKAFKKFNIDYEIGNSILCLVVIYDYFYNYLSKDEKDFYDTHSFSEMYDYILGDNAVRG